MAAAYSKIRILKLPNGQIMNTRELAHKFNISEAIVTRRLRQHPPLVEDLSIFAIRSTANRPNVPKAASPFDEHENATTSALTELNSRLDNLAQDEIKIVSGHPVAAPAQEPTPTYSLQDIAIMVQAGILNQAEAKKLLKIKV